MVFENKMVVLTLNLNWFSFIAFKILKAKSKIPTIQKMFILCLNTNEMKT